MALDPAHLPDDIATLKAMLLSRDAEIENLRLTIAKMQRDRFGAKSERGSKLLDQLELQLAELEEGVAQDRVAGELVMAPGDTETDVRNQHVGRCRPICHVNVSSTKARTIARAAAGDAQLRSTG